MIFTEFRFLFFFVIVLAVYWSIRHNTGRKWWLLVVSYVFYGAWDYRFLGLLWVSTGIAFTVGALLRRTESPTRRRGLLLTSVVLDLAILGFFKYFDFFADSAASLLSSLGLPMSASSLEIVLPVGISFYTFHTMNYVIDVYRGKISPARTLLDLGVFVAFFPQLVAGPIVRASDFLPQLGVARSPRQVRVRAMLVLFFVGFVKKAVIANNAALVADAYFADPGAFSAFSAWVGVAAYAIQIYCDFSGYSDIAIASAGLLGLELAPNFRFPYLARNIAEFWRRWHISLSSWLRDYLYVPLGGSRGPRWFVYRNLMLTMLLGGLWHGAAWRFVVWGGLHGVALVAHRAWTERPHRPMLRGPLGDALATGFTLYWVLLAWIFFRATDLSTAWATIRGFVFLQGGGGAELTALGGRIDAAATFVAVLLGIALVHWVASRGHLGVWRRAPAWMVAAGIGLALPIVSVLVPDSSAAFIYFQF